MGERRGRASAGVGAEAEAALGDVGGARVVGPFWGGSEEDLREQVVVLQRRGGRRRRAHGERLLQSD